VEREGMGGKKRERRGRKEGEYSSLPPLFYFEH